MRFNLDPMFKPKSVAVIGASRNPDKVGHVILQNYISAGYSGKLYPINLAAESILGLKAYKSVLEIGEEVEMAVIAIPAEAVPKALAECGKAGVKAAVVVTSGFKEVGNAALQDEIVKVAKKYHIAMLGPNCLGVMDTRSRTDTLFLPTYKIARPQAGYVSFVSQSGGVGSTLLDVIASEGFGLSKFISYGNAAYIDEVDILEYLMHDKETKVIVVYIEGITRGKEFVELARKITKVKPVIVLKAGRTEAGAVAAHSHTAALAGNYAAYEAVFKQFGFTVADDFDDLINYAKAFASEKRPKGNRVAIITNGGGVGVIAADDVASSKWLKVGSLSSATKKALAKVMPSIVNITIPMDIGGDGDSKRYGDALSMLSNDPNIDMLLVIVLFQTPGADSKVAAEVVHQKDATDKPVVAVSIGSTYTQTHKMMLEEGGVPVYESPLFAVKSLEALLEYAEYRKRMSS